MPRNCRRMACHMGHSLHFWLAPILRASSCKKLCSRLAFFYNQLMLIREWIEPEEGQGYRYLHAVSSGGCDFFWHYHPEFELTFAEGGSGRRYIGTDAEDFAGLDLALVAPNQPHSWHYPGGAVGTGVNVVFFTLDWLRALAGGGAPELAPLCQRLEQLRTGVVFSPALTHALAPSFVRLRELRGLARLSCLFGILASLQQDEGMRLLQGYRAD